MRKTVYFTGFFLLLTAFNASSTNLNCLRCKQREIALPEMQELKPSRLSKAFISVFFYKADNSFTEVNDEQASTSDISEKTKIEKEHRIIFFTKTGKIIEGDNIHMVSPLLNISTKELKKNPSIVNKLFENNSPYLSDQVKEQYNKGDIEIAYINNIEQLLSKETNDREHIKKLLLIDKDTKFTGSGRCGPQTRWKLLNLGIDLELTHKESLQMKAIVENLIKNRAAKYNTLDQTASTSTGEQAVPKNE